jgi:hypothetical protein
MKKRALLKPRQLEFPCFASRADRDPKYGCPPQELQPDRYVLRALDLAAVKLNPRC